MPRTKSGNATEKILKAETLRLAALRQNPLFCLDLETMEEMAHALSVIPPAPLILLGALTEENFHLSERQERLYTAWSRLADGFFEQWGFRPRIGDDGKVHIPVRMPVSFKGYGREWKLNTCNHPPGDAFALAKHYESLLGKKKPRRHRDVAALKIEARKLRADGKSVSEIAEKLFPFEYRAAIDHRTRLQSLIRRIRRYL